MYTKIKTNQELAAMRESGKMLATVLDILQKQVSVGITTKELADIASRELKGLGGQPAFLGYQGFPDVLCVSINEQVVHGIPNHETIVNDGDIVSMDFGVTYRGMITDSAISLVIGNQIDPADKNLVDITKRSLFAGIEQLKGGVGVGRVSHAIEQVLSKAGYGIVRDLVGHGVGHELHEEPNIPNYGHKDVGPFLSSGMTIAIEPMATRGGHKVRVADDGWTIYTADHTRSAHFEHTILITDQGSEILTTL